MSNNKELGIIVTGSIEDISEKLNGVIDLIVSIPDRIIEIATNVDSSALNALETELNELDGEIVNPTIDINDQATIDINTISDELTEIDGESASATVNIIDHATEVETEIRTGLDEIEGTNVSATANIDGSALEEAEEIKDALLEIDGMDVSANVTLDGVDDVVSSNEEMAISTEETSTSLKEQQNILSQIVGALGLYKLGMDGLDYDKYIEQSLIYGHATDDMKGSIIDLVNSLSGASQPANDVAEAFAYITRATRNVGDAMLELPGIMHYVKTSGADLENSVYILTNLFEQYNISAEQSADTTAYLADLWTQTKLSGDQFLSLINRLSTDMQTLGFSIEDTAAIVAAFDQSGVSADQTMRAMRSGFSSFINDFREGSPAVAEMEEAIKSLGIATRDSAGNLRPAKDVLSEVLIEISKMPDETARTQAAMDIFGKTQGRVVGKLKVNYLDLENQAKTSSKGMSDDIRSVGKAHQDAGKVINNEQQKMTSGWGELASKAASWVALIIGSIAVLGIVLPPLLAGIGKTWDFVFPPEAEQKGVYDKITNFNKEYLKRIKTFGSSAADEIYTAGRSILRRLGISFGDEAPQATSQMVSSLDDMFASMQGEISKKSPSVTDKIKGIGDTITKYISDWKKSWKSPAEDAAKVIDNFKKSFSRNNVEIESETTKTKSTLSKLFDDIKAMLKDERGAFDFDSLANKVAEGIGKVTNSIKEGAKEWYAEQEALAEQDAKVWGEIADDVKKGMSNVGKTLDEGYTKLFPKWKMEDLIAEALGKGKGITTVTDDFTLEFRVAMEAAGHDLDSMFRGVSLRAADSIKKGTTSIANEMEVFKEIFKDEKGQINVSFIDDLTYQIESKLPKLKFGFDNLKTTVIDSVKGIVPEINMELPKISDVSSKIPSSISENVTKKLPNLKLTGSRLAGEIAGWGPAVAISVVDALANIGDKLKDLGTIDMIPGGSLIDLMPWSAEFKKLLSPDFWTRLVWGDEAANKLILVLDQAVGKPMRDNINKLFADPLGYLSAVTWNLGTDIYNGIASTLGGIPAAIGNIFTIGNISASITSFINYLWTIPGQITGAFNIDWYALGYSVGAGIGNVVAMALEQLYYFLQWLFSLPQQAQTAVVNLGTWLYNGLLSIPENVNKGLDSITKQFWDFINYLKTLPGQAYNWIMSLGDQSQKAVTSIPGKVEEGIDDTTKQFWDFINYLKTLPGQAYNWIIKMGQDIYKGITGIPGQVQKGLEDIWKRFTDFLGWISSLPGQLYNAIVKAWEGFVQGIKDQFPEITYWLDKIRGLFPHSPPKWGPLVDIMDWGGNMADAISSGLDKSFPNVAKSLANQLDTLKSTVSNVDLSLPLSGNISFESFALPRSTITAMNTSTSTTNEIKQEFIIKVEIPQTNNVTKEEAQQTGETIGKAAADKISEELNTQMKNLGIIK